jgi:quinol monooxygenase YgiN
VIVGTLRLVPPPQRLDEVLEILRSVRGPVMAQQGCVDCSIYEERGPEGAIVLVERFESEETLEAHVRSDAYRRVLGAIELSGAPPDVRFDFVSASEGMEFIERSRSPGSRRDRKQGDDERADRPDIGNSVLPGRPARRDEKEKPR